MDRKRSQTAAARKSVRQPTPTSPDETQQQPQKQQQQRASIENAAEYNMERALNEPPKKLVPNESYVFDRPRKSTDSGIFYIFLAMTLLWICSGVFIISKGDIKKFLKPKDSEGHYCGEGDVANRKHLFYFESPQTYEEFLFFTNVKKICVKECPTKNFNFQTDVNASNWHLFRDALVCTDFRQPQSYGEAKRLVSINVCTSNYAFTTSVNGFCIAEKSLASRISPFDVWANNFIDVALRNQDVKSYSASISMDLYLTFDLIVKGVLYGIFLTVLYIALLRWIAGALVWISISAPIFALSYCLYKLYVLQRKNTLFPDDHVGFNVLRLESFVDYFSKDSTIQIIVCWILLIVLVVFAIIVIIFQTQIRISIALIKESSKAVISAFEILPFPILPLALQLLTIFFSMTVYTSLLSVSEFNYRTSFVDASTNSCLCNGFNFRAGSECVRNEFRTFCEKADVCPLARCEKDPDTIKWYLGPIRWLNVIMFFWVFNFISAAKKMILAFIFSSWYWSLNKSSILCKFFPSVTFTFRYHSGTLAFGSLVITVFKTIKLIFDRWFKKKQKLDSNYSVNARMCCNILFKIFEKFIRILNENAYIMCAIYGNGFLRSAKKAFKLLLNNPLRYIVLVRSVFWLFLLARIVISLCASVAVYISLNTIYANVHVRFYEAPVIATGLITFYVTKIFFTVYEMAIYTIFVCFCEDCEKNDGSSEKPYYMANKLQIILPKKDNEPDEDLKLPIPKLF